MKNKETARKMRNTIGTMVLGTTLLAGSFGAVAYGATDIKAQLKPEMTIMVDGVEKNFYTADGQEAYPIVYNGTTYLPVRAIGELMGKEVIWNSNTDTIMLQENYIVTDADSFVQNGKTNASQNSGILTSEEAKKKALAHAGLSSSQVSFVRQNLEWEDGRQVYDVEFYTADGKEYDYEIDANTGAILSYDFDAEYYRGGSSNTSSATEIGETKVKSIAVAQVPGASESNIVQLKRDYDDGRLVYDVKIIVGTMEYEMEIDAYTGSILSRDAESIYD